MFSRESLPLLLVGIAGFLGVLIMLTVNSSPASHELSYSQQSVSQKSFAGMAGEAPPEGLVIRARQTQKLEDGRVLIKFLIINIGETAKEPKVTVDVGNAEKQLHESDTCSKQNPLSGGDWCTAAFIIKFNEDDTHEVSIKLADSVKRTDVKEGEPTLSLKKEKSACPETETPVCGTDGKTYTNGCQAEKAGTRTASKGRCTGDKPVDNPICKKDGESVTAAQSCCDGLELKDRVCVQKVLGPCTALNDELKAGTDCCTPNVAVYDGVSQKHYCKAPCPIGSVRQSDYSCKVLASEDEHRTRTARFMSPTFKDLPDMNLLSEGWRDGPAIGPDGAKQSGFCNVARYPNEEKIKLGVSSQYLVQARDESGAISGVPVSATVANPSIITINSAATTSIQNRIGYSEAPAVFTINALALGTTTITFNAGSRSATINIEVTSENPNFACGVSISGVKLDGTPVENTMMHPTNPTAPSTQFPQVFVRGNPVLEMTSASDVSCKASFSMGREFSAMEIPLASTNNRYHSVVLNDLTLGNKIIYYKCKELSGRAIDTADRYVVYKLDPMKNFDMRTDSRARAAQLGTTTCDAATHGLLFDDKKGSGAILNSLASGYKRSDAFFTENNVRVRYDRCCRLGEYDCHPLGGGDVIVCDAGNLGGSCLIGSAAGFGEKGYACEWRNQAATCCTCGDTCLSDNAECSRQLP